MLARRCWLEDEVVFGAGAVCDELSAADLLAEASEGTISRAGRGTTV